MSEAVNRPVLTRSRRGASEADEFAIGQSPDVILPATGPVVREPESIIAIEGHIENDAISMMAFMEEPMTIYLEPNGEEDAAQFAYAAVNGKDAEVFYPDQNKWVAVGFLPVGVEITTKRKYVEVLARSKPQRVKTKVEDPRGDPRNVISRFTHSRFPFSVLEDRNPKGRAWLSKVKAEG